MPEVAAPATISQLVSGAAARLVEAGVLTPRLDAEVLLAFVLGCGRERLVLDADCELSPNAVRGFERVLARRAAREPVAYITGTKEFRWISLQVDSRVLIPRPETELLVEAGLSLGPDARVLDVGTGSGAVALALKHERCDLEVVGSDLDPGALPVARDNARRLNLSVRFVCGDLLEGAPGSWDAVLANLPYVPEGSALPPEVAEHEPASALFAGRDGLEVIRRLVAAADVTPLLALEIGVGQAGAVGELLRAAGFTRVECLHDLAGIERVIIGRR